MDSSSRSKTIKTIWSRHDIHCALQISLSAQKLPVWAMSSAIRDDKSTRIRRRLGVYQWNEIDKRTIFHLTHSSLIHSVVVVVAYCCVPIIYLTHTQLPTDSGSVWTLNWEVNSDSRTFVFFAHENLLLFLSIILFLQKVLIFSCRLLLLLRCVGGQELNYMHRIGFHGHTRAHSKYNCRIRRPTRRLGASTPGRVSASLWRNNRTRKG